jgi:hypothetical protein
MIQKTKRKLNLGVKECLICGKEFQPASGAQRTCSPECKEKAKAQGLTKRGPRKKVAEAIESHEGETPIERMRRLDRENPLPSENEGNGNVTSDSDLVEEVQVGGGTPDVPTLNFDLTPLTNWMQTVVYQLVHKEVKGIVEEILKEKFQGLLGK